MQLFSSKLRMLEFELMLFDFVGQRKKFARNAHVLNVHGHTITSAGMNNPEA